MKNNNVKLKWGIYANVTFIHLNCLSLCDFLSLLLSMLWRILLMKKSSVTVVEWHANLDSLKPMIIGANCVYNPASNETSLRILWPRLCIDCPFVVHSNRWKSMVLLNRDWVVASLKFLPGTIKTRAFDWYSTMGVLIFDSRDVRGCCNWSVIG